MGSLGSYLKSAREARGLDLRDAAQQTRISIGYLKAIEDEDFSKLPGAVFVKGFLKNYARFLQLPEDEVMQRFGEIGKSQPAAAPAAASPKDERQKRAAASAPVSEAQLQPERPGHLGIEPFLWAGAVIIGLVTFILVAMPGRDHGNGQSDSAVSTPTGTGLQSAATATGKPDKLYLEIVALEDVWILVRIDASPQKKAALKKGEAVTWSADERFLLSYSSVGAARIVLNGKELAVNGQKTAVVRDLIVTAAGIAFQKVESEQPKVRKPRPATLPTATVQLQQKPQDPAPQRPPEAPQASAPAPAQPPAPPVAPITLPPGE
ncbi:MAG: RodZ domain-containing protein [Nitrospirota bacterium]